MTGVSLPWLSRLARSGWLPSSATSAPNPGRSVPSTCCRLRFCHFAALVEEPEAAGFDARGLEVVVATSYSASIYARGFIRDVSPRRVY
eukprot:scaffold390271_cov33-Prasinocladus_malaysianus.AAC.1